MMTAFAANSAPPGAAAPAEILCPMCDYNLHGLTAPRCPECGYAFDWADLLDPTRRKHKYLFEHHPERNVWSFCRTAVGGLVPWRFWRSLRPEQLSHVRRLIVYWLITALGVLTLPVGGYALICVYYNANNVRARPLMVARLNTPQGRAEAQGIIDQLGSFERYLDEFCPVAPSRSLFAYRLYMRFPHALATVMLALTVTFLFPTTVVINVPGTIQPLLDVLRSLYVSLSHP